MERDLNIELEALADHYLDLHQTKERLFWDTKVGLSDDHSSLENAEVALRRFLGDADRLESLRGLLQTEGITEAQTTVLDGWIEMIRRNVIEDESAQELEREIVVQELELERARMGMELNYEDPDTGAPVFASSVVLSNTVRNDPDERRRKAAWLGLRSIETFVLKHGFPAIVRDRNRFARKLGYEDYYDYRVQWAEGFDKATLFSLLDNLESLTREPARQFIEELKDGDTNGHTPWNYAYAVSGSLTQELDPYFQFSDALERWARTMAGLGIHYRGANVTIDLIDRKGKYENGFMHLPTPAYMRRGSWLPAEINFTANAVPNQPGGGRRALATLFHEGGHAAHFANIIMDAPCFSQEFAPTSVAFAETQSMLLDSLTSDADWQTRYARNQNGQSIPFDLIARSIELQQPSRALGIRQMLQVCYAEKALYEMPEEELTPSRILEELRKVEEKLVFMAEGAPRPTLSIPHLLSGESSAYYHGYVLAEMAVEQTRNYFFDTFGTIVDNPKIGTILSETFWRPGNSISFLEFVKEMTGQPLSADALVERATRSVADTIALAQESIESLEQFPAFDGPLDLDIRLSIIHGEEVIATPDSSVQEAVRLYRAWIQKFWGDPSST